MPRWSVFWVIAIFPAFGQTCVPARLLPAGTVSGALDDGNCQLSDATAYAPYRLDLPVRGQLALDLNTSNDFVLILRDSTGAKVDSGLSIHREVEAGSYTVLVDARVAGQVGAYAITSAFTAEPGMLCSAFPSLGINQTANGALGSSGCTLPAGAPYEGYWVNTYGAGTLNVTVTSADFTPTVIVRASDGSAVASGQGMAAAPVDAGSQYEIVVTTADKTGAYQIATGFQIGNGETCSVAKNFSGSDSDSSAVTSDSCFSTLSGSGDLYFYNYYSVALSTGGTASFHAASKDFQPTLTLLDESGNSLAIDSGVGTNGVADIRLPLPAGNYTLLVVSSVASGGAYDLQYQFAAGAPSRCAPVTMDPAGTQVGALDNSSCRTATGPSALYSIAIPSAGTLDLTISSDSLSVAVALRDAKDNLIVLNEDVQGQGMTHVSATLPAGTYTVAAGSISGTGAYQLTSQFTAKDVPACSAVQTVDINGGYVQRLGLPGCIGANGQPVDYYQFTLPADGVVAAFMTSSDVDGYLTLLDSKGNALRSDDNSYAFADPMIVQYLPAGTYRLAARAAGSSVGGYYEVDVRTTVGPRPPFCGVKGMLAVGGAASGTIGYTSCQYTDATFADIYQFQLTNSTTVDLKLTSSDFDAYL